MKKRRFWLIPIVLAVVLVLGFGIYVSIYYHATGEAKQALVSDNAVRVSPTSFGWLFDGPSEEDCLIFYPGAKVEEKAYAPFLRLLAEKGMDVCLVRMPFRLAFFDSNAADRVRQMYAYSRWYIGGHSLGGAMAALYASDRGEGLTGVILLAAYPTRKLDDGLPVVCIYGSEDRVLNLSRLEQGRQYVSAHYTEKVVEGGNHAQIGNYGEQAGDGRALISRLAQQQATADIILQAVFNRN